jgi:excinuclease ABC subunit C
MAATEETLRKLETVPDMPGAYLFRDEDGKVIYVGKARSLRKRLRQHLRDNPTPYGWTEQLYARLTDFDYTVTRTELEAFILEASLIKEHRPRYNIRLSDDKSYPYLKLTDEMYPRLIVLRDLPRDAQVAVRGRPSQRRFHDPARHEVHGLAGGQLFGPYADARSMRRVMRLVPGLFGLRSCSRRLDGTPHGTPCLQFHIGRCQGPCRGLAVVTPAQYDRCVHQTADFLEGRLDGVAEDLEREMNAAAAELAFERAAKLRDQLRAVRRVTEDQVVVATENRDQDVVGVHIDEDRAMVVRFSVRAGRLVAQDQYPFAHVKGRTAGEVTDAFLTQHYARASHVPAEVLVSDLVADAEEWSELLSEARGSRVRVYRPERGDKRRLVELAVKNAGIAQQALARNKADQQRVAQAALGDLADVLDLKQPPRRIECFDISTTQGRDSTGSQVVFTDGLSDKKAYRSFRMRATEGKPDDYAMMAEMIRRRLQRALAGDERFLPLPDLILVDGGKGQLSTAGQVVSDAGLEIPLAGLAKQQEEVFVPWWPDPLDMSPHQPAHFLLQRIRDEAHRFAIGHHRGLRDAAVTRSLLDEVPGIGPERKRALLATFPSVQALAHASVDEIASVKGMSRASATALLEHLTRATDA